jgi:hypothetical protein
MGRPGSVCEHTPAGSIRATTRPFEGSYTTLPSNQREWSV